MTQMIGAQEVVCSVVREEVEIVGVQIMEINDGLACHIPVILKYPVGSWTPPFQIKPLGGNRA